MKAAASPCLVLAAAVLSCGAAEAECTVRGGALIVYAKSRGFQSNVEPVGGTTCDENWPAVTVGAPLDVDGRCLITYFDGARLAPGWSLRRYSLIGLPFRRRAPQAPVADSLSFTVMATAEAGESGSLSLRSVTLDGPDCRRWKDALTQ